MEAPQPHRKFVYTCVEDGAADDADVDKLEVLFDSGGCTQGRRAATSVVVAVGEIGGAC